MFPKTLKRLTTGSLTNISGQYSLSTSYRNELQQHQLQQLNFKICLHKNVRLVYTWSQHDRMFQWK